MGTEIYMQPICVILGLGREMNEIFIVLGRYAVEQQFYAVLGYPADRDRQHIP